MSGSDSDSDSRDSKRLRSGRLGARRKEFHKSLSGLDSAVEATSPQKSGRRSASTGACALCNNCDGDIRPKEKGPSKTVSESIRTLRGACVTCNPGLTQFVEIANQSNPAGDLLSVHVKKSRACIGWGQFSLYSRRVKVSYVPRLTAPSAALQHGTH